MDKQKELQDHIIDIDDQIHLCEYLILRYEKCISEKGIERKEELKQKLKELIIKKKGLR